MKRVSGKEMCKILRRNGWKLQRIKGAHHHYYKDGFPLVTVPVHGNKTLKQGIQHGIMKDARLTEQDL